ncbi:hypothetical protein, partial [Deinococcus sp.]|uniref:hypothetical protein n=1 Tax=Deinococcus sp. TaxID=47478 RepID=UPI002869CFA9
MLPPADVSRAIHLVRQLPDQSPALWPGFEPNGIPLLVYDGEWTWLDGAAPQEPGWIPEGACWRRSGRHPALTAHTAVTLPGGTVAAGVLLPLLGTVNAAKLASILVHEAFHVYQGANPSVAWAADELAALTYPAADADVLHARAEETRGLAQALAGEGWVEAAWHALHWRQLRHARLGEDHTLFETRMETTEGLAHYVESRFLDVFPHLNAEQAAAQTAWAWAYGSGAALAHLLDHTSKNWQAEVLMGTPLHELLAARFGPPLTSPLPTPSLRLAAQEAAQAHAERLRMLKDAFHAQGGQRLTLDCASRLTVAGFDPLNLHALESGCVLHTRFLKVYDEGLSALTMTGGMALAHGNGPLNV